MIVINHDNMRRIQEQVESPPPLNQDMVKQSTNPGTSFERFKSIMLKTILCTKRSDEQFHISFEA